MFRFIMGSAAKKPRPMRSIRSGIKKLKQIKENYDVLNKLKKDLDNRN
jgi:hypothetical protein